MAGAVPAAASAQQRTSAPTSLVFDGVTVVDVEQGKLLPAQRVVIASNRIQAVGHSSAVAIPTGAQVVNAQGKYLIPGLWDMHSHPGTQVDFVFPLLLANGVTGIRVPASRAPLDTQILWRREVLEGRRVGPPRQILSGSSISGPRKPCVRGPGVHICVADSADARHVVDSLKAAGSDMIKMYSLSKDMYLTIAAEARRVGIPFGGHLEKWDAADPGMTYAEVASDSGARIVDHLFFDPQKQIFNCWGLSSTGRVAAHLDKSSFEECQPIADRFRRNGTWWVPTFFVYENFIGRSRPILDRLQNHFAEFWTMDSVPHGNWLRDVGEVYPLNDLPGFAEVAQRVGMPMLAGTDSPERVGAGFALHAELAVYVAEGFTPLIALQSATLNPAKLLHGTDSLGTVAAGKLADLVLLDADPLADITNTTMIRAVVANGRYFDRAALNRLLAELQAKARKEVQKAEEP